MGDMYLSLYLLSGRYTSTPRWPCPAMGVGPGASSARDDVRADEFHGPQDDVPAGVDLCIGWSVVDRAAIDPAWNHVAAMRVEWSEAAGRPGHWVELPNGESVLIVTARKKGQRHPALDRSRHANLREAMRPWFAR
jgi:hypothetical protein